MRYMNPQLKEGWEKSVYPELRTHKMYQRFEERMMEKRGIRSQKYAKKTSETSASETVVREEEEEVRVEQDIVYEKLGESNVPLGTPGIVGTSIDGTHSGQPMETYIDNAAESGETHFGESEGTNLRETIESHLEQTEEMQLDEMDEVNMGQIKTIHSEPQTLTTGFISMPVKEAPGVEVDEFAHIGEPIKITDEHGHEMQTFPKIIAVQSMEFDDAAVANETVEDEIAGEGGLKITSIRSLGSEKVTTENEGIS